MEKITVIYFPRQGHKKTLSKLESHAEIIDIITVNEVLSNKRSEEIKNALSSVSGDYFTVVDEGDSLPNNYLDTVKKLEREHSQMVMMFGKKFDSSIAKVSMKSCEEKSGDDERLVELTEDIRCIPISLNGTFVPTKWITLWEDKGIESEKNFLLKIMLQEKKFYYIGSQEYVYVNPADSHFEIFQNLFLREWYYESITDFLIPLLQNAKKANGYIPEFLQYFAMFFLCCRLEANKDNRNKHILEGEEGQNYKDYFRQVLSLIDNPVIAAMNEEQTYYKRNISLIRMFYQIKGNNYELEYDLIPGKIENDGVEQDALTLEYDGNLVFDSSKLRVNVLFIEYENECWEMDLSIPSHYGMDGVDYYVQIDGKPCAVRYSENYSLTKYFGQSAYKRINFHATVPIKQNIKNQKVQFVMEHKGVKYYIRPEYQSHTSRLSNAARYLYWRFDKFIAFQKADYIVIRQAKKWYTAYRELRVWAQMAVNKNKGVRNRMLLRMGYHLAKPIYGKKKIWMFYDKIYKGGDSAEYIYKYASQFDDGIEKYYLIDKDCPDRKRLEAEGYKPLIRGTIKHRLIFLYADMMIVSNSTVFAFNNHGMKTSAYIRDLAKFHVVCVQHGMSVQKIAIAQRRLRDNTRLYFCASKYEIENLSKPVYDYIGYDALKLTGVPRYDGLIDDDKKVILISPTWRMQAAMLVSKNEGVARDYNPYFKETNYYKVYNSLINDKRLLDAAKEYGYKLAYVLHPIVSPQVNDFDKNEYVDIIPAIGDMSYEKLFRESSLMVTDFSGVQFDFAYMRKPLVYLHHKDLPQHYEEGTFFYDTMGFGEICTDNDELIDLLCEYMAHNCEMKDMYKQRADDFFTFNDHNNCQRIYDEMIKYQTKVDRVNKIV